MYKLTVSTPSPPAVKNSGCAPRFDLRKNIIFPSVLPTKILYAFLVSSMYYPLHVPHKYSFSDLINVGILSNLTNVASHFPSPRLTYEVLKCNKQRVY